jgi:hypothetical protein
LEAVILAEQGEQPALVLADVVPQRVGSVHPASIARPARDATGGAPQPASPEPLQRRKGVPPW